MEYPKHEWCLYLKGVTNSKGVDLTQYDGYIGRETGKETPEYKTLKLFSTLGYQKGKEFLEEEIDVPLANLRLGFQSTYKQDYYNHIIKEIDTKYLECERDKWLLTSVFSYYLVIDKIIEHNGILNNDTIEDIAKNVTGKYMKVREAHIIFH